MPAMGYFKAISTMNMGNLGKVVSELYLFFSIFSLFPKITGNTTFKFRPSHFGSVNRGSPV